jgi:hypothetical protein
MEVFQVRYSAAVEILTEVMIYSLKKEAYPPWNEAYSPEKEAYPPQNKVYSP